MLDKGGNCKQQLLQWDAKTRENYKLKTYNLHITTDTAKILSDYISESRRNVFSYCKKNQETRLCVTFILKRFVNGKGAAEPPHLRAAGSRPEKTRDSFHVYGRRIFRILLTVGYHKHKTFLDRNMTLILNHS